MSLPGKHIASRLEPKHIARSDIPALVGEWNFFQKKFNRNGGSPSAFAGKKTGGFPRWRKRLLFFPGKDIPRFPSEMTSPFHRDDIPLLRMRDDQ